MAMEGGKRPPVDELAQLTVGRSTEGDIVAALGQPQGHGGVLLPETPQDLWVYNAEQINAGQMHMQFLLVFVDHKARTYDGYLWFRSGQLMGPQQ